MWNIKISLGCESTLTKSNDLQVVINIIESTRSKRSTIEKKVRRKEEGIVNSICSWRCDRTLLGSIRYVSCYCTPLFLFCLFMMHQMRVRDANWLVSSCSFVDPRPAIESSSVNDDDHQKKFKVSDCWLAPQYQYQYQYQYMVCPHDVNNSTSN